MARIPWLADVLRAAGLTVVEVPGWRGHGGSTWSPTGGIVHATADGAASNPVNDAKDDAGAINVIRNGRPGLTGPIANAYHARDGRWHVIADGRCNTALTGTAGPLRGIGNSGLLGIEHENDNRGEPWPAVQYDTAVRGWAAICRKLGWSASRLAGHKEHDPSRKSDPKGIDMAKFRRDVAAILTGGDDDVDAATIEEIAYRTKLKVLGDGGIQALLGRVVNLEKSMTILLAQSTGDAGADEIVATIRAEAEQTRAAMLTQIRDIAPTLAQSVADQLGPEVTAGEIGEALARELAQMLTGATPAQGQARE